MGASFDSKAIEQGWVQEWEAAGVHSANRGAQQRYTLLLPPPNVTGALHIGHALTVAVQDSLCRWRRMHGDDVVWVPGMDHAGIATQTVVERQLSLRGGRTRHSLGRAAFEAEARAWSERYAERIRHQLRRMGAVLNWEREYFTLDGPRSAAVTDAFRQLHAAGQLYRGMRMVNWCPALATAISDIEVEVVQVPGRTSVSVPGPQGKRPVEVGVMHTFRYPLVDRAGDPMQGRHLSIATTRLETMLGDVAVAVHPDDERYAALVRDGCQVRHPITGQCLPIVADGELVDPALGTGAVKLTPAHDPNDHAAAVRHGLPVAASVMMDGAGKVSAVRGAEAYQGMDRFEARTALVEELSQLGLYEGAQDHAMALATCSRSGDILEPFLLPQWFVRGDDMARDAAGLATSGALTFSPPQPHGTLWQGWLGAPQDWCISRQLWWGHRIPAFYAESPQAPAVGPPGSPDEDVDRWVVAGSAEEARALAAQRLQVDEATVSVVQDADVLDTWFSSGLLPASAAGDRWPLSAMETGHDILFFWVARMVMLCRALGHGTPFPRVLLHPMVRDKHGRKMSKSLGNVIDPLAVIEGRSVDELTAPLRQQAAGGNASGAAAQGPLLDPAEVTRALASIEEDFPDGIPPCGTDALRVTLCGNLTASGSLNLDVSAAATNWRFCNKMWNAVKFAMTHLHGTAWSRASDAPGPLGVPGMPQLPPSSALTLPQRWVLSRAARAASAVDSGMEAFRMSEAVAAAQSFWLNDVCDVFVEAAKVDLKQGGAQADAAAAVLAVAVDTGLRLLHPFMPFVTEELWQRLMVAGAGGIDAPPGPGPVLAKAPWPAQFLAPHYLDDGAESSMDTARAIVAAARALAQTAREASGMAAPDVRYTLVGPALEPAVLDAVLCLLKCSPDQVRVSTQPAGVPALTAPGPGGLQVQVLMPSDAGAVEKMRAAHAARVKKLQKLQKKLQGVRSRLANPKFRDGATEAVVQAAQHEESELEAAIATLQEAAGQLQELLSACETHR